MDLTSAIEHAIAALEPGAQILAVQELTGGVSADVAGVALMGAAGVTRRVVVRRHPSDGIVGHGLKGHGDGIAAREHGLLAALHRLGFPVPEPYLCGDAGNGAGPYLVMEWVDGSTEVGAADLPAAIDQMARFLVELHALDPTLLELPDLDELEDPRSAITPYLPATETGRRVAAALPSTGFEHEAAHRVLLHGDYWPGNILWREGRLVAVIDWEDACLGDPLADLATARVELTCQYGADAMVELTDRYLADAREVTGPVSTERLAVWDLYVSAAALSAMSGWGLDKAEEARRRRLTEQFFEQAAHQLA